MECGACGQHNRAEARFCTGCGARLAGVTGTQTIVLPLTGFSQPTTHSSVPIAPPRGDATLPPIALAPARPWPTVPGPIDRVSFFAEQARHRRATWRLTAVCAVAAVLVGLPLSLILTPLLFAVVVLLTKLADVAFGVPAGVWAAYRDLSRVLIDAAAVAETASWRQLPLRPWLLAAGVWLLPGVGFMLLLWPCVRMLFHRGGVGGVLLTLGARSPDLTDLEERQVVNVVEEMATAAGLPAPRVMLLDDGASNAAAVGSGPDDAVIIVGRRLLDAIDRDETQALLGHLIGSVGNGDLGVALTMLSVYQTFGLVGAVVRAPIDGKARATVGRVLRFVLRRRGRDAAADAAALTGLLGGGLLDPTGGDLERSFDDSQPVEPRPGFPPILFWYFLPAGLALGVGCSLLGIPRQQALLLFAGLAALALALVWYQRDFLWYAARRGVRLAHGIVILPYYMGALMPQFLLMLLVSFILSPLIATVWRTRRYLADATAVQLTRNPDALARGLATLTRVGGLVPHGRWAAPLFVVGPEIVTSRLGEAHAAAVARRVADRGVGGGPGAVFTASIEELAEHAQRGGDQSLLTQDADEGLFGGRGALVSFHPPIARRLARLIAQGATVEPPARSGNGRLWRATYGRWALPMSVLVSVLLALAGALMVVAAVLLLGLGLLFCALLMALVFGLLMVVAPPA